MTIYDGYTHPGTRPDVTFMNETIVYASAGENMSLSCSTADQADSIAWYFNNVPVTRGTDMRGELWFTPLRETDNGWYTCAAANRYGRVERDFLLVVVGKFLCVVCVCVCVCVHVLSLVGLG